MKEMQMKCKNSSGWYLFNTKVVLDLCTYPHFCLSHWPGIIYCFQLILNCLPAPCHRRVQLMSIEIEILIERNVEPNMSSFFTRIYMFCIVVINRYITYTVPD